MTDIALQVGQQLLITGTVGGTVTVQDIVTIASVSAGVSVNVTTAPKYAFDIGSTVHALFHHLSSVVEATSASHVDEAGTFELRPVNDRALAY